MNIQYLRAATTANSRLHEQISPGQKFKSADREFMLAVRSRNEPPVIRGETGAASGRHFIRATLD